MNSHEKWLRQVAEGLYKQALYNWSNTCEEAAKEIGKLETQKASLLEAVNAKQARIDALMMEFCPGEMSAAQRAEWAKHQQPALETSVTRCSHGVPIDPAIPCEKCGSSPMTTCARCGATVNIRGVRSDGWIDVEPHNCPTANR